MSPLSCILNQKYRIIIGCRSLIVNGRMTTFKIVGMNIFPNRFPCFTDIGMKCYNKVVTEVANKI